MGCDTYSVWYGNLMLADKMSLENALLFVEALFQKFWNDPAGMYTIKKETPVEEKDVVQSKSEWQKGYDVGHEDGYKKGFSEGYDTAGGELIDKIENRLDWAKAYNDGANSAWNTILSVGGHANNEIRKIFELGNVADPLFAVVKRYTPDETASILKAYEAGETGNE